MEYFLQQLVHGFTLGSIYSLIALGYTLIFGVIGVIFFAQGDLTMVSALVIVLFIRFSPFDNPGFEIPFAFILAFLVTIAISVLSERLAIRPIREAPRIYGLVSSLGVSIIIQNIALKLESRTVAFPFKLSPEMNLLGIINLTNLIIIGVALFIMFLLYYFVKKTDFGISMRAVMENRTAAQLAGINANRIIIIAFIIGGLLASITGIMMGVYDGVVKYNMGFSYGIKGFTAAILGGLGNIYGAMLGGILLGLSESIWTVFFSSQYKDFFAFLVLIAILAFRSRGILKQ